jgi:hypothetical protein
MDYIKLLNNYKDEIDKFDINTDDQTFEGLFNIFKKIQDNYSRKNTISEFEIFTDDEYQNIISKYFNLFGINFMSNEMDGITHYTIIF